MRTLGWVAGALVVGAGVVGLTCAVRLLEDGHHVDIVARDLGEETTSGVAAALWYPYRAHPVERVTAWSAHSYAIFAGLAVDDTPGVTMCPGTELRSEEGDPWWSGAVPNLTRTTDVRPPYVCGLAFEAPVVEMPVYLSWLHGRVGALGGTISRADLSHLPDGPEIVINASGLGARELADDTALVPARGQVAVVSQVGLERWWLDESGPTYVVPRTNDIVVGGTAEDGEWDLTPSTVVAREILDRATTLVPELEGARVVGHRVGLRPMRPTVRLETDGHVIHCYGHGGAGVTLSWGCADEVAGLVQDLLVQDL